MHYLKRGMKNFKSLFSLVFVVTCFSCSSGGYGKEYKLDSNHNVYYKGDSVDKSMAKKLAVYLKEQDYFRKNINSTVQLVKLKDTYNLNFVVDETKITAGYDNNFLILGAQISEMVFKNTPVTVQLTNNKLEPFKNLGYAKPISDTLK